MPAFDGPLDGCYEGKMSFNPKDYYIENIKFQSSTIWSSLWRAPGSSAKLGLLNQSQYRDAGASQRGDQMIGLLSRDNVKTV